MAEVLVFMDRVEMVLKQKKLTQKELAEELGLRRPSLSDWKKNGSVPAGDVCLKIANYLNVSVEWLICGTENELSKEERWLISQWQHLTEDQKNNIRLLLNGWESARNQDEKNSSSQA